VKKRVREGEGKGTYEEEGNGRKDEAIEDLWFELHKSDAIQHCRAEEEEIHDCALRHESS